MKRIFLLAVFALAFSLNLGAQDTTAVKDLSLVDSSLVNTSVFSLLSSEGGGSAVIDQTDQVRQATMLQPLPRKVTATRYSSIPATERMRGELLPVSPDR